MGRRRGPGLIWRVLFGHNGPTKARLRNELEKKLRLKLTDTFVVTTRDATGRVRKQTWRINPDGTTVQVQQRPKKKATTKPGAKGAASKPSKPSRASKAGGTQRRQTTPAAPAVRAAKPASMRERALRNPDGKLAGSRKDPEKQAREAAQRKAEQAYLRASQHAEQLLGWDQRQPDGGQ